MPLLKEAVMEQGAAKMAWFGPQGSGKTTAASEVAIGLSLTQHKGAPVAFFDTEKGSDFARTLFELEGVKLMRVKSRAFADLVASVKEAEEGGCCALVVDSMSHVWAELMESFCRRKRIQRIEFQHWRELKETWRRWTDAMLNSRMHMLICGRAGKEYEYQENEETGKKELISTGTKFKAEGEFGYEPDVLMELWIEREEAAKRGSKLVHKGIVLKDRSRGVNGREFVWKDAIYKKGDYKLVYECFNSYFHFLNIGGAHLAIDTTRTSDAMFDGNGHSEVQRARHAKDVCLEEIENTLVVLYPGQDQKSKRNKLLIIEGIFKTRSWEAVKAKSLMDLEDGLHVVRDLEKRLRADQPEQEEGLMALLELSVRDAVEKKAVVAKMPF